MSSSDAMPDAEDQHIEWKEIWRDDCLRWICGFANSGGGSLHIGRDDQGRIVGLSDAKRLLEEIPNKARDLLGILVSVNLRKENGLPWLEIAVDSYPHPISYRGHYFVRSGSTLQELKGPALDRFLLRRHGRTWDSVPVPGVKIANLSASAIRRFRGLARAAGRIAPEDMRSSKATLVEKLQLAEGTYLKRAAVLLFHEDPEKFITGAFVKIGYFRSESDLAYHDTLHGDLFSLAARTIDLLQTKYLKAAITYRGIQRIERYPVPDAALRESILNALVHRDYAVPAPIQIRVYANRLSIWNPCSLPEGWTLKKLLGPHSSAPHNPAIAHVFFRSGEIETWGRGIQRILTACREAETPKPRFTLEPTGLWTEFPFAPSYLQEIHSTEPGSPPVTGQVSEQVSEQVAMFLRACVSSPKSKRELLDLAGLSDAYLNYKRHILPLLQLGLIKRTIPEKPNSRLQKYRLTEKGRALAGKAVSQ